MTTVNQFNRIIKASLAVAFLCVIPFTVMAQTPDPRGYIFEDFTTSPTGWTYSRFSSGYYVNHDGISGDACLRANIYTSYPTASVTTSYVAMGTNPVVSFKYIASTNYSGTFIAAADNALQYTVSVSTDGTTWTNLSAYTNIPNVSSTSYATITVPSTSLSAYQGKTVKVRITFSWVNGDSYIWLDDVAVGTVPPIFYCASLDAGTLFNNYSSPMSANTRTLRITNKGSQSLTVSLASTTEGVTITGLPVTVPAFETHIITVVIDATKFMTGGAYNGSFTVNINEPNKPTVTTNITGTVRFAQEGLSETFTSRYGCVPKFV